MLVFSSRRAGAQPAPSKRRRRPGDARRGEVNRLSDADQRPNVRKDGLEIFLGFDRARAVEQGTPSNQLNTAPP